MKQLLSVWVLTSALLLAGCQTPYQKNTGGLSTGGYEDVHIRSNTYYVTVTTNAWTSTATAAQYFHRRAKEVCEENGYRDYRIREERDTSTESVAVSGGYGGASGSTMLHPGFAGYVDCLR